MVGPRSRSLQSVGETFSKAWSNILFSGTEFFFFFLFGSLRDLLPQPGIEPVPLAPLIAKAQSPNHWEFPGTGMFTVTN